MASVDTTSKINKNEYRALLDIAKEFGKEHAEEFIDKCIKNKNIVYDTSGNVTSIDMSGLHLHGSLSSSLGQLIHLIKLDLSNNSISGHIPLQLGDMTSLRSLDISSNELAENIPPSIGKLVKLEILDLSKNKVHHYHHYHYYCYYHHHHHHSAE